MLKFALFACFFLFFNLYGNETLNLRQNLSKANPGDYIVAAQNKNYILLNILAKTPEKLTIQEISIPASKIERNNIVWKEWVQKGAPAHTSWIKYTIILPTGEMQDTFSFSSLGWQPINLEAPFLPTLLNLRFTKIADKERKKVGDPLSEGGTGGKKIWQPPLIINGQQIRGALLDAWRAHWPRDRSPLSDKIIEVYIPREGDNYPSYFPYWLQVSGAIGKADLRIIDSGTGLTN